MVTPAVIHPSLWLLSSQHLQPRLSAKTQICMLILMCGWQLSSFREPKALSRTTPWSVPWAHSFCFLNLTDNAILQLPSQKHESTLNFLNLCLHSLSSLPFPNIKTKSEKHYQILNISFLYKAHDHFSYPKPGLEQCSSCLWTKLVTKAVSPVWPSSCQPSRPYVYHWPIPAIGLSVPQTQWVHTSYFNINI